MGYPEPKELSDVLGQAYRPGDSFRQVRETMLQPSPLSDEDIEEIWRQEPLNMSPQLHAEETHDQ